MRTTALGCPAAPVVSGRDVLAIRLC